MPQGFKGGFNNKKNNRCIIIILNVVSDIIHFRLLCNKFHIKNVAFKSNYLKKRLT